MYVCVRARVCVCVSACVYDYECVLARTRHKIVDNIVSIFDVKDNIHPRDSVSYIECMLISSTLHRGMQNYFFQFLHKFTSMLNDEVGQMCDLVHYNRRE